MEKIWKFLKYSILHFFEKKNMRESLEKKLNIEFFTKILFFF